MGDIPIVSLDKIYLSPDEQNIIFLDCTRLDGSENLVSRINVNDFTDVDKQVKIIAKNLRNIGQTQIILADDVVFSGSVLKSIIRKFRQNQIEVMGIRTPVSTVEAYEYFNNVMLLGLSCGCLLEKDCIDQICERDFYFGVAQSGISIVNDDGKVYKAPYFKPFGNPIERASIPNEYENFFSDGCLNRSLSLWSEIERLSNRKILIKDLPEKINLTNDDEQVVKVLKRGRM